MWNTCWCRWVLRSQRSFPSPVCTVCPAAGCWSLGVNGKGTPQTCQSWCRLGGRLSMVTHINTTRAGGHTMHRQMQSHASCLVQASKISDGIVESSYARWEQWAKPFTQPSLRVILTALIFLFFIFLKIPIQRRDAKTGWCFMSTPGWRSRSPQAGCHAPARTPGEPKFLSPLHSVAHFPSNTEQHPRVCNNQTLTPSPDSNERLNYWFDEQPGKCQVFKNHFSVHHFAIMKIVLSERNLPWFPFIGESKLTSLFPKHLPSFPAHSNLQNTSHCLHSSWFFQVRASHRVKRRAGEKGSGRRGGKWGPL